MKRVISIFIALGMFILFVVGINLYYSQKIIAGAQSLTYQNTDERNSSLVAMKAILNENSIPVFGSSELSSADNIGYPAALFNKGNSDFNMILIGRGSMQSLHDAISIGAMADEIEDKKAVVIISPQWFGINGIGADAYASRFSERLYVEMLKNHNISYNTKRAITDRVIALLQETDPNQCERVKLFDSVYVENTAGPAERVRCFFWNMLQNTISTQKSLAIVKRVTDTEQVKIEDIDFPKLMNQAEQAAIAETTNNSFYVYDEYFNKYMVEKLKEKENSVAGTSYIQSIEYDDLKLMLQVCKETGIHPLLVNIPVNGWWYDYIGMTQEARNEYYQKIRDIAKESGVSMLDFSDKEYEPYFLRDIMHLGKKGWVYMDEAVYRYHSSDETQMEYPFESKLNVDRRGDKTIITLATHVSDVRQAHLISDGEEVELSENSQGYLVTDADLRDIQSAEISIEGKYGAGTVLRPVVIERENLFNPSTISTGVTEEGNGYNFSTDVAGNVFNLVTFQIYDGESGEFIMNFGENAAPGFHGGIYRHEYSDGIYKIVFKANSNRKDETLSCDLELRNGKNYSYEYNLVLLETQHAEVNDIGLYSELEN